MTTPPSISGCSGRSMPLARNPFRSSQTATQTAAATRSMNAVFQKNSDSPIAASSTIAKAMAALRSRPARPWSLAGAGRGPCPRPAGGCSYFEQFGFLVLERLVDRVGVLLGEPFQSLLGAGDVV